MGIKATRLHAAKRKSVFISPPTDYDAPKRKEHPYVKQNFNKTAS
jgi:hypothetical protein